MSSSRRSFALVHTWPELRNAEYEVVQRIVASANNIGASIVVIDDNGKILWSSPELMLSEGTYIRDGDVDFLLSLHFLSPRLLDIYSYITLWQPIQFYHQFGYQECVDKVASHNDLISCGSDLADWHGLNLLAGLARPPVQPLPKMFHAIAQPFLAPHVTEESRLFYIGINWERIGGPKGRFHDTLTYLDSENLTDIYGPQKIHGEPVWDGFKTYRGELPFDGESIKYAANRAGICLALSSQDHKHAGIMSNRLFEGLAGGAAIIATPNSLIDKYFRDMVYLVDDTKGDDILGQQIIAAMRRIRANPDEAMERVSKGQDVLRNVCSLEYALSNLFELNSGRISTFRERHLASGDVTVILRHFGESLDDLSTQLIEISRQHSVNVSVKVICGDAFHNSYNEFRDQFVSGAIKSIEFRRMRLQPRAANFDGYAPPRDRFGITISKILAELDTEYFAFLRVDEHIFSDHYATILKAIQDEPGAKFGCSGAIEETRDASSARKRTLNNLKYSDFHSVLMARSSPQPGRFVFHKSILNAQTEFVIPLLDGEESTYFQLRALLEGPLAQSAYATYVLNEVESAKAPLPVEPVDYQLQYIRDAFAADARWLDQVASFGKKPEFVYAFSPGGPARWDQSPPQTLPPTLALEAQALFRAGSPAVRYLVGGFSYPEEEHVWIEGERGVLEFTVPLRRSWGSYFPNVALRICALGRRSAVGREQHCTLALNGAVISYFMIPDSESEISVPLPKKLLEETDKFRLELIPEHREPVYSDDGNVSDARYLSIMLKSLLITSSDTEDTPIFEVGKLYIFEPDADSGLALYENFYGAEPIGVWMAGSRGALRFRLEPGRGNFTLDLALSGRRAIVSGDPQTLRATVNGTAFPLFTMEDGANVVSLRLPDLAIIGGVVKVDLEISHAEAVFDDDHNIVDPRLLGLCLHSLMIRDEDIAVAAPAGDDDSSADGPAVEATNVRQDSPETKAGRSGILAKVRKLNIRHKPER